VLGAGRCGEAYFYGIFVGSRRAVMASEAAFRVSLHSFLGLRPALSAERLHGRLTTSARTQAMYLVPDVVTRLIHLLPGGYQLYKLCIRIYRQILKVLDSRPDKSRRRRNNHRAAASPFSTTSVCPALPIAAPNACVRNASPRVFSITDW
jgi:hypothetical protein